MLALLAAAILASPADAKTIAMIRDADDLILSGHERQGTLEWFQAAARVVDPRKLSCYNADDQEKNLQELARQAIGQRRKLPHGICWISPISEYGDCIVESLSYPRKQGNEDGDFISGGMALVWQESGLRKVELISPWTGRFPVVDGPAYRTGNSLVAAGPGNMGENRDSAVLRLWHRSAAGWKDIQTIQAEYLTNDSYFPKQGGRVDPNIFIARSRVPTPLNDGGHPGLPHRVLKEIWKFNGSRYVRLPGHFENTAFLSLERFLLAMRTGDFKLARRYADKKHLEELKKLGACSWHWPARINGVDEGSVFDLDYNGSYDLPTCRVTLKRAGDHWRVVGIDPRHTAKALE